MTTSPQREFTTYGWSLEKRQAFADRGEFINVGTVSVAKKGSVPKGKLSLNTMNAAYSPSSAPKRPPKPAAPGTTRRTRPPTYNPTKVWALWSRLSGPREAVLQVLAALRQKPGNEGISQQQLEAETGRPQLLPIYRTDNTQQEAYVGLFSLEFVQQNDLQAKQILAREKAVRDSYEEKHPKEKLCEPGNRITINDIKAIRDELALVVVRQKKTATGEKKGRFLNTWTTNQGTFYDVSDLTPTGTGYKKWTKPKGTTRSQAQYVVVPELYLVAQYRNAKGPRDANTALSNALTVLGKQDPTSRAQVERALGQIQNLSTVLPQPSAAQQVPLQTAPPPGTFGVPLSGPFTGASTSPLPATAQFGQFSQAPVQVYPSGPSPAARAPSFSAPLSPSQQRTSFGQGSFGANPFGEASPFGGAFSPPSQSLGQGFSSPSARAPSFGTQSNLLGSGFGAEPLSPSAAAARAPSFGTQGNLLGSSFGAAPLSPSTLARESAAAARAPSFGTQVPSSMAAPLSPQTALRLSQAGVAPASPRAASFSPASPRAASFGTRTSLPGVPSPQFGSRTSLGSPRSSGGLGQGFEAEMGSIPFTSADQF